MVIESWNPANPVVGRYYKFDSPLHTFSKTLGVENETPMKRTFKRGMLQDISGEEFCFVGRKEGCKRRKYKFALSY